jgi:hypothetical protein
MRKKSKIILISVLLGVLVILGVYAWNDIERTTVYSMKDLLFKYPLISDLKIAVDSGELDYNKLPSSAKEALRYYESSKDLIVSDIIKGINP